MVVNLCIESHYDKSNPSLKKPPTKLVFMNAFKRSDACALEIFLLLGTGGGKRRE